MHTDTLVCKLYGNYGTLDYQLLFWQTVKNIDFMFTWTMCIQFTIQRLDMKHARYIFTLTQNFSQIVFPQWRCLITVKSMLSPKIRQM